LILKGGIKVGKNLIKISVVYFSIGAALGLYMSITHSYTLSSVHAHINLLGWISLAIAGILYTRFPVLAATTLAKIHFWIHNITLPIMMIGLGFILHGQEALTPIVAASGTILVISIILFAINVLIHLKQSN
jgi:hypothetical protein